MKNLKLILFIVMVASFTSRPLHADNNTDSILHLAMASSSLDQQESIPEIILKPINQNIETTLTFLELQEILLKINEDLEERITKLEYADKKDMAQILKKRQTLIILELQKLQLFDHSTASLYLNKKHKKQNSPIFLTAITIGTIATITALFMASYDADLNTLDWPQTNRLVSNFHNTKQRIISFFTNLFSRQENQPAQSPVSIPSQTNQRHRQQNPQSTNEYASSSHSAEGQHS